MAGHTDLQPAMMRDISCAIPLTDPTENLVYQRFGVVKIKNIPYSTTIQEVNHFVSRIAGGSRTLLVPHVHGFPIHIIMDRSTGKTMDCYVELLSQADAVSCVQRSQNVSERGKPLKIGQRHVDLVLSSEGELMSTLFPRAKFVDWDAGTGEPHVRDPPNDFVDGFKGFFTVEEVAGIVRHAENPQRSPYSQRCLQRTYESMVTFLYKFPWKNTMHYTVTARDYLFSSYMAQLRALVPKVVPTPGLGGFDIVQAEREVGLSHSLLMDLLFAGLNTPSFSLLQKWQIAVATGTAGAHVPMSAHAARWPFQCLAPMQNCTDEEMELWLDLLDVGFVQLLEDGQLPDFDGSVNIFRICQGYLAISFTTCGLKLKFGDAMDIERQIAELLIYEGQKKAHAEPSGSRLLLNDGPQTFYIDSMLSQLNLNDNYEQSFSGNHLDSAGRSAADGIVEALSTTSLTPNNSSPSSFGKRGSGSMDSSSFCTLRAPTAMRRETSSMPLLNPMATDFVLPTPPLARGHSSIDLTSGFEDPFVRIPFNRAPGTSLFRDPFSTATAATTTTTSPSATTVGFRARSDPRKSSSLDENMSPLGTVTSSNSSNLLRGHEPEDCGFGYRLNTYIGSHVGPFDGSTGSAAAAAAAAAAGAANINSSSNSSSRTEMNTVRSSSSRRRKTITLESTIQEDDEFEDHRHGRGSDSRSRGVRIGSLV